MMGFKFVAFNFAYQHLNVVMVQYMYKNPSEKIDWIKNVIHSQISYGNDTILCQLTESGHFHMVFRIFQIIN
jgi:hypothetical protein